MNSDVMYVLLVREREASIRLNVHQEVVVVADLQVILSHLKEGDFHAIGLKVAHIHVGVVVFFRFAAMNTAQRNTKDFMPALAAPLVGQRGPVCRTAILQSSDGPVILLA